MGKIKPQAVLISDAHYNLHTLPLADAAMRCAISKANELDIPLIVAGDLHDTKANLRGECVKAMIESFKLCKHWPKVLIGNHDLINEKSKENSLSFLESYVELVERPTGIGPLWLIPYSHDTDELRKILKLVKASGPALAVIMHQGLDGSDAGEYIQDKSAITHEDVKDFRVISGHYHRRQDIKTGRPQKGAVGVFSYIGNPFTLGFGEANHPEKGFQILMDDGTLEFVSTNLRKHVVIECSADDIDYTLKIPRFNSSDLLWVKLSGTREQLEAYSKKAVARTFKIEGDFRLDLIPTDSAPTTKFIKKDMSQGQALDAIIDSLADSEETKSRLKDLWRKSASN